MNHSRISCKEYWDHENEEDEALNLPNFIDIIGLDVQLSNQKEEDTVNSQIMRLIINGKLQENYDLLDFGKKLKEENERKEGMELVDIDRKMSRLLSTLLLSYHWKITTSHMPCLRKSTQKLTLEQDVS